jgi:uncharacterized membrane protein YidH (DUF202 family)
MFARGFERVLQFVGVAPSDAMRRRKREGKRWAEGHDAGDIAMEDDDSHDASQRRGYDDVDRGRDKRICVPQKIDPKTFFANERTFLKWMSISAMLGAVSVALLNFADIHNDGAEFAGIVLLPVAIFFMVHALVTFRHRAHCIYMREPMRYDDTRGPTMLVIVLAAALLLSTYFSLQRSTARLPGAAQLPSSGAGVDRHGGGQSANRGIPAVLNV